MTVSMPRSESDSPVAARFWHLDAEGRILCDLCPHCCRIPEGRLGRCGVRQASGGTLQAIGYGRLSSIHTDPIEKKPLYHFFPGSTVFSVGGWGCNLSCAFCQNWTISQRVERKGRVYTPADVVQAALQEHSPHIAYTYNEPLVAWEFVMDCARLARQQGLANVLVTNGYIRPEPAAELLPFVDALNIDIKSFEDSFYREHCRGTLDPVLSFCRQAARAGCHVEITNLLIPGLNDQPTSIEALASWIQTELGPSTVLHFSAYHPDYRMRLPPTPLPTLTAAREIASRYLPYVYLGNVHATDGQNTHCPECRALLIRRRGYHVCVVGIRPDGRCAVCEREPDVIGPWGRRSRRCRAPH